MKTRYLTLIAGGSLIALSGCIGGANSREASTPNEFRVVTKAPLTIPPEYNLRPPAAGQSLPAEIDPARTQLVAAFGTNIGKNASAGERALVAAAGANAISPIVRSQVDYEEAAMLRKSSAAADQVIYYNGEDNVTGDSATGGSAVTIARGDGRTRLKLPGT